MYVPVSICDFQYIIVCTELTVNETFISDEVVITNVNSNFRKPQPEGHYRKKGIYQGSPKVQA